MRTICILSILFIALLGRLSAQITSSFQDTMLTGERIEEVRVTAFRSPYNLFNTPAPVNLIPSLQIQTGNSLNTVEALNQVPGVLMHNGTLNTNRLTIRGIGSRTPYSTNKIKAYFGEIPLTSGDGETTLEDLENSAIQRIEIIKGPSSSLYGAGLAGVILFHPKMLRKNFVHNETGLSSFGTFKNTLTAGISREKLTIFALGSVLSSDAYRENNKTNRGNILLNSMYSFSGKSNLQLLIKATNMKAFIPSSLDLPTFETSPESAAANWAAIEGFEDYSSGQFGLSFNRFTEAEGKISAAIFGSIKDLDELRPFNRLEENSDYIGWRMYWQKIIPFEFSRLVFTTGFEMFRENYEWSTYSNEDRRTLSDNNEKRQYENIYGQLELNVKNKFFASAGLNVNLTRFKYTDNFHDNGDQSGKRNYDPVVSPRLGLNVLLDPKLSVYGNVSHGFSTPSFEETLFPEGDVNPAIMPESGWSFELGFRSQPLRNMQFSGSYYRIYVNDLLVARRTGEDAYVGVNAGQSVHPGFECEFKWNVMDPDSYPSLSFSANATFANYHFKDFIDEGQDYSGNRLPGTAKTSYYLGGIFTKSKNISFLAWHRYTGKMPLDDANTGYSDSFGITNAEIRYKGTSKKLRLELKGGIQNIFDIHYASMLAVNAPSFGGKLPRYYYPGNPRNYYLSILIGFETEK